MPKKLNLTPAKPPKKLNMPTPIPRPEFNDFQKRAQEEELKQTYLAMMSPADLGKLSSNVTSTSGTQYANVAVMPSGGTHRMALKPAVKAVDVTPFVEAAKNINYELASSPQFQSALVALAAIKYMDWIKWGEKAMSPLRSATDLLAEMNRRLSLINTEKWVNDTIEEASRKPGFMDRFAKRESPAYYDAMLAKCRMELEGLLDYIAKAKQTVADALPALDIDMLAFQVFTSNETDGTKVQISTNRLRSLVASRQSAEIFLQTAENAVQRILKYIQDIDHVRDVTVTAWKVAHAAQQP